MSKNGSVREKARQKPFFSSRFAPCQTDGLVLSRKRPQSPKLPFLRPLPFWNFSHDRHDRAPIILEKLFFSGEVCQMSVFKTFRAGTVLGLATVLGSWSLATHAQSASDGETIVMQDDHGSGFGDVVVGDSFAEDSWQDWQKTSPSCGGCGDCERCRRGWFNLILHDTWPRWTAQVDALLLWQNNIASRPLFGIGTAGPVALDANDLQTPATGGPRFGLFLHLDDCYSIEGNYFTVDGFQGQRTLPPGIYDQLDLAGLRFGPPTSTISTATATSSGAIQSAELNWRRRADVVTWLAGFRWVQWNAGLAINDQSPFGQDEFNVLTGNDLYGGQAGCDLRVWELGNWLRVNALGKAGIFYNPAYQRTTVFSPGATAPDNLSFAGGNQAEQTGFFGELGVNATLQIRQWLAWRVGYNFFWLSGVATPAEQLSVVNADPLPGEVATVGINTNGSVLLQGISTGIEARW
jgi:hypothetical protein